MQTGVKFISNIVLPRVRPLGNSGRNFTRRDTLRPYEHPPPLGVEPSPLIRPFDHTSLLCGENIFVPWLHQDEATTLNSVTRTFSF